jgi:3-dehydroquinate dehydratase
VHARNLNLELTFRQSNHAGKLSNIHADDESPAFEDSSVATGVICGSAPDGYIAAMQRPPWWQKNLIGADANSA